MLSAKTAKADLSLSWLHTSYCRFCRALAIMCFALLQQGIKQEFYRDLVFRFRKVLGKSNFSEQFRKLINHYKRIGSGLRLNDGLFLKL